MCPLERRQLLWCPPTPTLTLVLFDRTQSGDDEGSDLTRGSRLGWTESGCVRSIPVTTDCPRYEGQSGRTSVQTTPRPGDPGPWVPRGLSDNLVDPIVIPPSHNPHEYFLY